MRGAGWLALCKAIALFCPVDGFAESAANVACRGSICVTLADLERRFDSFPVPVRQQLLDSPDRMEQLLDDMLLRAQLAEVATSMQLEKEDAVQARIRAARDRVLADEALQRSIDIERPDFDVLAGEKYLLNPGSHAVGAHRVVQHLLVGLEQRSETEALRRAQDLRQQALSGVDFTELLLENSDDPSRAENRGRFEVSEGAQLVQEFKQAAAELRQVGDISEPVRTEFGFHLIKYVSEEPSRPLTKEEAIPRIASQLESEWLSSRREKILADLRRVGTSYHKEGFEALRRQYSQ